MYEDRYGTDWETLEVEGAIERAYALGVLAGLGADRPEEYDRVREAVDTGPGVDMVELAYDEGRQAVADIEARSRTDRATWAELVEDGDEEFTRGDDGDADDETAPPSAPPSSLSMLDPPEDDPGLLDLPAFLRRD